MFTIKSMISVLLCWWGFIPPANAIELHTKHCLFGCPTGAPSSNDYIVRDNYTMSSNEFTKFSDWIAYTVTAETIGSGCSRNWKADPYLDDSETLEPDDYDGAHDALSTDRGHQVPLASFCGTDSWKETNFLSNITPQKSELNQGPWKRLEDRVRSLAKSGEEVYVLTGTLYTHVMPAMPEADEFHVVPSGYWKVIAVKEGSTVSTASFVFDQGAARATNYCDYKTTINIIQSLSNLKLFPDARNTISANTSETFGICP